MRRRPWLLLLVFVSIAGSEETSPADSNNHRVSVHDAEDRDCSHLKGRLYSDCRCKGALPRVRSVWGTGQVMAAVAAATTCDRQSPGLDAKDRVLLQAVHASATRVRTAFELARKGDMLDAVSELLELFDEVKRVPETPVVLLHGPLAYSQCRWWVLGLRRETQAGMPPDARISVLAERVGKVCADALSEVLAGSDTARCKQAEYAASDEDYGYGSTYWDSWEQSEQVGGLDDQERDGRWPKSAVSPIPWLMAARLASFVAMGRPTEAVEEARLYGAVLEEGGLDMSDIIPHFSAPQCGPNASVHASMRHQLHRGTLWQAMSLLLCKRWQGLRLSACHPCAITRLWPLFSIRPGRNSRTSDL